MVHFVDSRPSPPSAREWTCASPRTKVWRRYVRKMLSDQHNGRTVFADRTTSKIRSRRSGALAFINVTPRQNEKPVIECDPKAPGALNLCRADVAMGIERIFSASESAEEWSI
eukprot:8756538-Pyramimonas_sp.AAC.1